MTRTCLRRHLRGGCHGDAGGLLNGCQADREDCQGTVQVNTRRAQRSCKAKLLNDRRITETKIRGLQCLPEVHA
jgi:hypothetical protein